MPDTWLFPDAIVDENGAVHRGAGLHLRDNAIVGMVTGPPPNDAVRLAGRVLLPGFANGHSHAFQRALRGRVERAPDAGIEDDFWTWRTEMYRLAETLDGDGLAAVCRWAFADMVTSGFVRVGEFHYLHHVGALSPREVAHVVAGAAQAVGVRLSLLHTGYFQGGFGHAPSKAQRRFVVGDADTFLAHVDAARADLPQVEHGVAIHSVRACGPAEIRALAGYAEASDLPLHVHVSEQRKEVADCRAAHGVSPIRLLADCGALSPRTVLVHATHIDDEDVALIAQAGALVCVCPSTERNLGDGLCPIVKLFDAGVRLTVGTDSHARIDAFDEARSLEDHERLRTERRAVLRRPGRPGLFGAVMPALLGDGHAALGARAGTLSPGSPADVVAVKSPPELVLGDGDAAPDALLLGAGPGHVTDVWVAGRQVVKGGAPTQVDLAPLLAQLDRSRQRA